MAKKSQRKWYFIGGAVVIILIIAALMKNKDNTHATKVTAELAQRRTIVETVSANGKIQPEKDIRITPYISGEVVELNVMEGDEVKEGDLLAIIDPELYISTYERMEASLNTQKANQANASARLAQVEAQFQNARLSFERSQKLFNQNVISQAEYDAAIAQYEVAKAEVTAAKESLKASEYGVNSSVAGLKEAKENLDRTKIYAPRSGKVSKLNIEKGERVMGASQFSAGTEIMRLADLQSMEVNVEVNENDIVRVRVGDTASIEVDAYLYKKFRGVVTEIATSANTTGVSVDQVTDFTVKIRVLQSSYIDLIPADQPNYSPLLPGMSATVEIETETAFNVLTVPIQAVTTRADTSGRIRTVREEKEEEMAEESGKQIEDEEFVECVFLYKDGKAILQTVKTGVQDNMYIEILEGLTEEDDVITGPYREVSKKLKNNDPVKKVDKKDLYSDQK